MAGQYQQTYFTPQVLAAQERYCGRPQHLPPQPERDPLGPEEIEFIQQRDSFYLATVSASGWPYVQHRGGEAGFLRVLSPGQLAFADYRGNRQMLSTGNLAGNDRVAMFLMDYAHRERLKILGHGRVVDARAEPGLVARVTELETARLVERVFLIEVISFDWNCPQFITPRYSAAEVEAAVAPLKRRIAELEARLAGAG